MNKSLLFWCWLLNSSSSNSWSSTAFVTTPSTCSRSRVIVSSSTTSNNNHNRIPIQSLSNDVLKNDIKCMKEEALERLQELNVKLQQFTSEHPPTTTTTTPKQELLSYRTTKPEATATATATAITTTTATREEEEEEELDEEEARLIEQQLVQALTGDPHVEASETCLEDTRWKMVFRIQESVMVTSNNDGSDETMEAIATDHLKPLLLHMVLDFTGDHLTTTDEKFFHSHDDDSIKVLEVKEAHIGSTFTSEGYGSIQNVQVNPVGGWKVLQGQGPKGIDVLRFYLDIEQPASDEDNQVKHDYVQLPPRNMRVFATCGYFSMENHQQTEQHKDQLNQEYHSLLQQYEDFQLQDLQQQEQEEAKQEEESIVHALLKFPQSAVRHVQRIHEHVELNTKIHDLEDQIKTARIRDPEKSFLRLSRKRDVALLKEGQICIKQLATHNNSSQKKKAPKASANEEYHVIGKMEMASIDKKFQDLAP